jgi:phosphate transport system permease protein
MRKALAGLTIAFSSAATLLLFAAVLLFVGVIVFRGWPGLTPGLIFGDTRPLDALLLRRQVFDGLFPAMAGTLALVALTMTLAVPAGLATGIYLAEYARGSGKAVISLLFDILAGLPSIVVGLAGLALTIVLHRLFPGRIGPCLLISSLALAFLILPYLVRSVQLALESLPRTLRLTAPALGADKLTTIRAVLLPACLPEIAGGIILAVGRAIEDTAVIMLTGAVASAGVPRSLLAQYEALPFYIYYISGQYADPEELQRGFAAALLLLAMCVVMLVAAQWLARRGSLRRQP